MGYSNARIDQILDEQDSILDQVKQRESLTEAQRITMTDHADQ